MKTRVALTSRLFLLRLALVIPVIPFLSLLAAAGGPKYIAGTSYFDPTVTGQPLSWPQGSVVYYTDQGDLSPVLPNASANSFVVTVLNQWASVNTAALSAARAGQLAEDVNGTNVVRNADGTISVPADIQSTSTATPIGIVYDLDGSVTDALLGAGASSQCFPNAAFGGTDNYGTLATYQHALIVLNGLCAQQSSQLPDLQYRLMRVIGTVLGLGWSQANLNVLTGNPHPTSEDYAGFPLMHNTDPLNCTPITLCFPNPSQLSADDAAALSRLYPITTQNQSGFPGKQVSAAVTARIRGSVYFTDTHGNRTQPMQGVNVVARWIDPSTGQPSRRYVVTSVSGFLFNGNDGNPITGTDDEISEPLDQWGSENQSVEGFFDLAGLPLPNGTTAQYQLSVEALDPTWSGGIGPYSPGPVSPSGSFQPITLTLSAGSDVQQDILMRGTAQPLPHASSSWTAPAALPQGANWISSLNNYDEVDYWSLSAQANRTLSVAVTALDESGRPTQLKAQPVIGMWAASDPQGASPPAFTPSPFNSSVVATTRLDTQVLTGGNFIVGISDLRGDGRPDYRYHARVLYGDIVLPTRIPAAGGPVTVNGTGFAPGLGVAIGSVGATQLAVTGSRMILAAPASSDGPHTITITDPGTGASTTMTNALLYGAAATDNIFLLSGQNTSTPVGTQAASPMTVRILAADGVTPVNGATVGWTASNGLQLSACGGASSCSAPTDENGYASTWLTPAATGTATITATLAPGVYSPAKSVSAWLNATQLSSDIGPPATYLWISQGATVTVPLTTRVVSNGLPVSNAQVNFTTVSGSGPLSSPQVSTSSTGYASVSLSVTQMSGLVQVSACVAPANTRCAVFYVNPVALPQQILQPVSGAGQVSTGLTLQPIVVRVTDSSSPPNPVIASPVIFQTTILRPGGVSPVGGNGETIVGNPAMPVILQASQFGTTTDMNGLASIVPSAGGFSPPLDIDVSATAATGATLNFPLELLPALAPPGTDSESTNSQTLTHMPLRILHAIADDR